MANFVLDSGLLLGYVRGAGYAEYTERKYGLSQPQTVTVISVVTRGEMYSLALQLGWPADKVERLESYLRKVPAVDISTERVIKRYADIDAFSQGRHPGRKLPTGMSSRNMGKNDLWIAATASVLNATLVTVDHDFDHLHGVFLNVVFIDQKLKATDA
jgi:tRNA(fMet)-specific endonuclease VapC